MRGLTGEKWPRLPLEHNDVLPDRAVFCVSQRDFFVFCLTLILNSDNRQWLVNSLDGFLDSEMLALG